MIESEAVSLEFLDFIEKMEQPARKPYVHGLTKIISGGQTGADRAALEAAQILGIATGGWAPPRFQTTAGRDSALGTVYGLKELGAGLSPVCSLVIRSKKNVDDADATLAFKIRSSRGTDKTIGYCMTKQWKLAPPALEESHYKPVLVIRNSVLPLFGDGFKNLRDGGPAWREDAQLLRDFLEKHNVRTLNVCGHRQEPDDPTWQSRVSNFLIYALGGNLFE